MFSLFIVSAHQPNIVYKQDLSQKALEIKNPEISQAFYAELKGNPEYYIINEDSDFALYISMTVPDIEDARTDFIFTISKGNEIISILNGSNTSWSKFHEEFANDDYLQGEEILKNVSAGEYKIKIENPDNMGKYVFVIGQKESFPFDVVWRTIYTIAQEKIYFEKNPIQAYFTIISLFFFWPALIILLVLIFIGIRLIRRKS